MTLVRVTVLGDNLTWRDSVGESEHAEVTQYHIADRKEYRIRSYPAL